VTEVRRRILFVGAFPTPGSAIVGGMVTSCRILLSSSFSSRLDLELLDSTQISNPPPGLAVRLALAARRLMQFIGRFERCHPDAVLLFVAVGASILEKGTMAWYARLRGVPAIMLPRGGAVVDDCRDSVFTRTWVKWSFRGATKIVCQSKTWRRFAIEVLGFAGTNVTVIRNWTATRDLLEIGARRVARQDMCVRLLFLGWLERDKGIFELIEACRRLAGSHRFTLDIAGEGNASAEARALVARHGLNEVVRFRGWLRGQHLEMAMQETEVFVLPSWAEGLPNAMIEAMAARLAIVVTGVGAIPEVITDRQSGILVEPRNADSLARALSAVIIDSKLRENIALEGHRIALRDFEVEAAVEQLLAEIEGAIVTGRGGRLSGPAL
jgi:glycosyltransferase involved in cell wall biosynthesis